MQGTAADLIKRAMLAVQDWLDGQGLATRLILQVHDELVFEVPDGEISIVREQLPKLMAGVAKLAVPLIVEVGVGPNWDEAH
jgi:DNA polymerase-1